MEHGLIMFHILIKHTYISLYCILQLVKHTSEHKHGDYGDYYVQCDSLRSSCHCGRLHQNPSWTTFWALRCLLLPLPLLCQSCQKGSPGHTSTVLYLVWLTGKYAMIHQYVQKGFYFSLVCLLWKAHTLLPPAELRVLEHRYSFRGTVSLSEIKTLRKNQDL